MFGKRALKIAWNVWDKFDEGKWELNNKALREWTVHLTSPRRLIEDWPLMKAYTYAWQCVQTWQVWCTHKLIVAVVACTWPTHDQASRQPSMKQRGSWAPSLGGELFTVDDCRGKNQFSLSMWPLLVKLYFSYFFLSWEEIGGRSRISFGRI